MDHQKLTLRVVLVLSYLPKYISQFSVLLGVWWNYLHESRIGVHREHYYYQGMIQLSYTHFSQIV